MPSKKPVFLHEIDAIRQICQPLKFLHVDDFFYMRVHNDGGLIDFATHLPWGNYFFDNLYQQNYAQNAGLNHFYPQNYLTLWEHYPDNEIWQEGRQHFEVGYGVTLFFKNELYGESYSFFTNSKQQTQSGFCVNKIDLLEKFIPYFKDKAQELIIKSEHRKILIPDFYQPKNIKNTIEATTLESFLSAIKVNSAAGNLFSKLTARELDCLYWAAQGKSTYEVGVILGCTKRTVDTHIANIKHKTQINKITSLINIAAKHGLT